MKTIILAIKILIISIIIASIVLAFGVPGVIFLLFVIGAYLYGVLEGRDSVLPSKTKNK